MSFWWRDLIATLRVRLIDKLDEACTNTDNRMMLVRHRSGDCVMGQRSFERISWATSVKRHISSSRQEGGRQTTTCAMLVKDSIWLMIAFITCNSNLVHLLQSDRVYVVQIHVHLSSRFFEFCRDQTDDLGINSPVLWATELVLHRFGLGKFSIASMAKKVLHRCIGAHARVHVHFLQRVCMHFDRCCAHHACAGVYFRQVLQVLWASAYTFAYTLATGCAYALMYVQFVHSALKYDDGGVQLV
jgi:hypothetical protein